LLWPATTIAAASLPFTATQRKATSFSVKHAVSALDTCVLRRSDFFRETELEQNANLY
jgi:hypothetical protein